VHYNKNSKPHHARVFTSVSCFICIDLSKLHIIFALKYNKQQSLLLLDKINLAAKYTFKNRHAGKS